MIGSTVIKTGTNPLDSAQDHRFALLTARSGLEPDLAHRYLNDPLSVLVEFGLSATEPVYATDGSDGRAPSMVREDLDAVDTSVTLSSYCNFTHGPVPAGASDLR